VCRRCKERICVARVVIVLSFAVVKTCLSRSGVLG